MVVEVEVVVPKDALLNPNLICVACGPLYATHLRLASSGN
jgi:hypothetical protein